MCLFQNQEKKISSQPVCVYSCKAFRLFHITNINDKNAKQPTEEIVHL